MATATRAPEWVREHRALCGDVDGYVDDIVPIDLPVLDRDGDTWEFRDGAWHCVVVNGAAAARSAPWGTYDKPLRQTDALAPYTPIPATGGLR